MDFFMNWSRDAITMTSYYFIGTICGSIIQIALCVGFIGSCVSLCCWCHKKCRKRRREQQSVVSVVYVPASAPPAGYLPPYPNYQPVPVSPPNSSLSIPAAPPPSYQEATDSRYFPLGAAQSTQMYPIPLQSDQNLQQPFNPDYCLPKYNHT